MTIKQNPFSRRSSALADTLNKATAAFEAYTLDESKLGGFLAAQQACDAIIRASELHKALVEYGVQVMGARTNARLIEAGLPSIFRARMI